MRTILDSPSIVSTEIACSDRPAPAEICRTDFGLVARALWPHKTAHALAEIAGAKERAARDWLAGRVEPPGCIIAEIVSRCVHKP